MNGIESARHTLDSINPSVCVAAGLDVHGKENQPVNRVEFVKPQLPPQSPYKTEPALKVLVLLPAEIHR
jgi:hypothetical protein